MTFSNEDSGFDKKTFSNEDSGIDKKKGINDTCNIVDDAGKTEKYMYSVRVLQVNIISIL